jgi:thiol:disulfide interchange protein DsbD
MSGSEKKNMIRGARDVRRTPAPIIRMLPGATATLTRSCVAALGCLVLSMVGLPLIQIEAQAQAPAPSSEVFHLEAVRASGGGVQLRWTIAPGSYLYRDRIKATSQGGAPIAVTTAPGQVEDDPAFGPTEIYHRTAQADIASKDVPRAGDLTVTYQGCSEKGICYPPVTQSVDPASLSVAQSSANAPDAKSATPHQTWTPAAIPSAARWEDAAGALPVLSGAPLSMLATFLGLGLLLSFTPCVFPMIPILSGILARSGPTLSARRGFVLSTSYVLSAALAYAVLGVVVAWSGENLQVALQTPPVLIGMSAVFVVLAVSMFGLFELRLPSAWGTRISALGPSRGGSLGAAAAMGFTSALIVGPCVTPPLAAALIYVAQTGDVLRGASALFALGIGMGLPLIAFGTFGAGLLPRAGAWLVVVRQAFGFVFLGLAIFMLSRVISATNGLALWAFLAIGAGVFAGGIDSQSNGFMGVAGKTIAISAIAYGIALMVGFASGASNPVRPLGFLTERPIGAVTTSAAGTTVNSPAAFDAALVEAKATGKPIIVEFTAAWCSACQVFERKVLANSEVQARMAGAALIKADITLSDGASRDLMQRFGIVGPPTLVFLAPRDGHEIPGTRLTGDADAGSFNRSLDYSGLKS